MCLDVASGSGFGTVTTFVKFYTYRLRFWNSPPMASAPNMVACFDGDQPHPPVLRFLMVSDREQFYLVFYLMSILMTSVMN